MTGQQPGHGSGGANGGSPAGGQHGQRAQQGGRPPQGGQGGGQGRQPGQGGQPGQGRPPQGSQQGGGQQQGTPQHGGQQGAGQHQSQPAGGSQAGGSPQPQGSQSQNGGGGGGDGGGSIIGAVSWGQSILYGLVGFVLAYAISTLYVILTLGDDTTIFTYSLSGSNTGNVDTTDATKAILDANMETVPSALDLGAWLLQTAHFVPVEDSVSSQGSTLTMEFAMSAGPILAVPAVVLIAMGYLAAAGNPEASRNQSLVSAATVVLGYAPLAAIAATQLTWSPQPHGDASGTLYGSGGFTVSYADVADQMSQFTIGAELGGMFAAGFVVYPAVLAAIGGVIAHTRSSGSESSEEPAGTSPEPAAQGGQGHGAAQQSPAGQNPQAGQPAQEPQGAQPEQGQQAGQEPQAEQGQPAHGAAEPASEDVGDGGGQTASNGEPAGTEGGDGGEPAGEGVDES